MTTVAATADTSVKIGVMSDMTGPYADFSGPGSLEAVKMAVEDFRAANKAISVEVVAADPQNKPDNAAAIARRWFDTENVDLVIDVPTSGVALAQSLYTEHAALDLGSLVEFPRDSGGRRQEWRQKLVFPDCRLHFRDYDGARGFRGHQGQWRHRPRLCSPPSQCHRLFLVPSSGSELQGADHRFGERRHRYDKRNQDGR